MIRALIVFQLTLAASECAQQGSPQPPDQDRISGTIVSIAATQSDATITIRSGKGQISHKVVAKMSTITHENRPSTPAEIRKGRTLNCIGGNHNGQFVARSCTVN